LHRGAYGHSNDIIKNKENADKFLGYSLHMVDMLLHYKIIPVMVFDGAALPSKKGTEELRDKYFFL
jgi:exonuclease-1